MKLKEIFTVIILLFLGGVNTVSAENPFKYLYQKTDTVDGFNLDWSKEQKTGVTLFRIKSGLSDNKKTKTINLLLKKIHDEEVRQYPNCKNISDYNYSPRVDYISQDVLGFTISHGYYCEGMPYTYFDTVSYLYDLNKGVKLKLNDVLNINASSNLEDDDFQKLDNKNILTLHKIRELIFTNENWVLEEPINDDSCNYYDLAIWRNENWAFTKKGIVIYPSFPTMSRLVCKRPFLISFEQLSRLKNSEFKYNF